MQLVGPRVYGRKTHSAEKEMMIFSQQKAHHFFRDDMLALSVRFLNDITIVQFPKRFPSSSCPGVLKSRTFMETFQ